MKWLWIGGGGLAVMVGAMTVWMPIPIGLPLLLLGTTLLMRHSRRFRIWSVVVMRRSPLLQRQWKRFRRHR